MKPNRTSQVVAEFLSLYDTFVDTYAMDDGTTKPLDLVGIFQRFQKMEEALESIKRDAPNCNCYQMNVDADCVCNPCKAKRALSFDPLQ